MRLSWGDEVGGRLRGMSLLFHNVRSAWGPGLEMLEAELGRWGVQLDVVGLAKTWLDEDSEKGMAVKGCRVVSTSRKKKAGGGEALMLRDGMMYREKPYLLLRGFLSPYL